ncbi:MAG: hypothetical protein ACXWJW_04335, partial [Xanthobacteraceae bacterium]
TDAIAAGRDRALGRTREDREDGSAIAAVIQGQYAELSSSCPGLTRASTRKHQHFRKVMDRRVKPGDDDD